MRRADGISISPNHLVYRWTMEVKRRESIKEERGNKKGDGEIERRNTIAIHNQICNVI